MKRFFLSAIAVGLILATPGLSSAQVVKTKPPVKAGAKPTAQKLAPAAEADSAPAAAPGAAPASTAKPAAKPATAKPTAVAAAPGGLAAAAADNSKPVAVISIAGYDKIFSNIGFFGKLSDNDQLATQLEGFLKLFTQNRGLEGLDKAQPWGVALNTDGESFQPLAFLPVTDLKELLLSLSGLTGEANDEGNGVFKVQAGQQPLYVKQVGKWAYIGQTSEALASVPADPLKLIGALSKQYDVRARIHVQNIPQVFRDMIIDQLNAGVGANLDRKPGEEETQYLTRKALIETQLKQITEGLNETDTLTLGWAVDAKTKSTYLEMNVTAVPGSKSAKEMAELGQATSKFAGFVLPNASFNMNMSAKIAKDQIQPTLEKLDAAAANANSEIENSPKIPNEQKEVVKKITGQFIEVFKSTVKAGQVDAGMSLMLDDKSLAFISGAFVGDSAVLENSIKQLVELGKGDPNVPELKFDADKHGDVRFHTMNIPIQKADAAQVLGDHLDVAIGIGPKSAYLALGKDSLKLVKSAIDKSASMATKKVPPVQMTIALESILKFGSAANPSDENVMAMLNILSSSPGLDHVSLSVGAAPNGGSFRIEAQEGILKVISKMSQQRNGRAR